VKKIAITTSSFAQFSPEPLEYLRKRGWGYVLNSCGRALKPAETMALLKDCVGVIAGIEIYDMNVLSQLDKLRVISRVGTGLDSIDLDLCARKGIKIFATPDGPTRAVAELVIGMMLNLLRGISMMDGRLRAGQWKKHMGGLFQGKTVGVVGLGRIGAQVAQLSLSLGAAVIYNDPFSKATDFKLIDNIQVRSLSRLFSESDIVSLHVPYNQENHHLVNKDMLGLMKTSALLINCARGGLVDEDALLEALQAKKISGAALDVFSQEPYSGPLTKCENVILTPHIGSYAREARVRMETDAVIQLLEALENDHS
jgi:D-3-phosphoglycerate dehydrogenase